MCERRSLTVKGRDKWLFFWLQAQRRWFVFPWVSDCSRPAECKHAVTYGESLDTVDPLQAISCPWGLRFDSSVLHLCSGFHPLNSPTPPNCHCEIFYLLFCHKYWRLVFARWKLVALTWKVQINRDCIHVSLSSHYKWCEKQQRGGFMFAVFESNWQILAFCAFWETDSWFCRCVEEVHISCIFELQSLNSPAN